jgi:hypothetical protein
VYALNPSMMVEVNDLEKKTLETQPVQNHPIPEKNQLTGIGSTCKLIRSQFPSFRF